jgi:PAS domain S-box-containing protein
MGTACVNHLPMTAEDPRLQVLLVDDEPLVLSSYARTLRNIDADILLAEGPAEGLKVLESKKVDVVIADYRMPGMNGDEFLEIVCRRWPETVRVLNTAYANTDVVEEVVRRGGIFRFLTKPCDSEKLRGAVVDALTQRRRMRETASQSKKLQLDLHSFRKIFHSALDPMMVADLDGRLVEVNEAFVRSMGMSREEALERRPTITSSWGSSQLWSEIRTSLHREGHWSDEVHHEEEDRYALLSVSVVNDDDGQPYALAAIEKDVTARRQWEQQSRAAQYEVIFALAKLAEYRDPETGAHLDRLCRYSQVLTQHLARMPKYAMIIDEAYIEGIYASSPLHDIGKVGIPDAVLLKPGKLTDEEWRVMRLHTSIGAEVLSAAGHSLSQKNWLAMARVIALQHHEKFDGTGYPNGLKGDDIDLSARIVALVDAYDAITSRRVYKPALSHEEARKRIVESCGTHFDPGVVQAFIDAEPELLAIKETIKDQYPAEDVPESPDAWQRIERLIESSSGRRP